MDRSQRRQRRGQIAESLQTVPGSHNPPQSPSLATRKGIIDVSTVIYETKWRRIIDDRPGHDRLYDSSLPLGWYLATSRPTSAYDETETRIVASTVSNQAKWRIAPWSRSTTRLILGLGWRSLPTAMVTIHHRTHPWSRPRVAPCGHDLPLTQIVANESDRRFSCFLKAICVWVIGLPLLLPLLRPTAHHGHRSEISKEALGTR